MAELLVNHDLTTQLETCPTKCWIKQLPLNNCIPFDEYNRKSYFTHIAQVLPDNDMITTEGKQTKKRDTVIKFTPTISKEEFNEKVEWLYIFVVNDKIVKIGGTRTGLKGRVGSYLCGHHVRERGKSGDCSKTNGFIYNTFAFYLEAGYKIDMYGYKLPKTEISIDIFEKPVNVYAQTFHAYESTFLEDFKEKYNTYPPLSDNCDPDYKCS